MSQKNVYNEIADAEKIDSEQDSAKPSEDSNTAPAPQDETDTPNAQNTTGLNVITDAKTQAKKFEFKNLQGELELTPTLKNFCIVRGSTIHLTGVGKYLSGFYFVTARTITITNEGALTIKLKVVKTKFGDSLKGEKPLPEVKTIDTMGSVDGAPSSSDYSVGASSSAEDYYTPAEEPQTYHDGYPVGGGNDEGPRESIKY